MQPSLHRTIERLGQARPAGIKTQEVAAAAEKETALAEVGGLQDGRDTVAFAAEEARLPEKTDSHRQDGNGYR
jgi:hypothetical protein